MRGCQFLIGATKKEDHVKPEANPTRYPFKMAFSERRRKSERYDQEEEKVLREKPLPQIVKEN